VKTINHVVTLSGKLDTQASLDQAVHLAKGVKGVRKVDADGLIISGNQAGSIN
jgi:hyperosmotically inducible protein